MIFLRACLLLLLSAAFPSAAARAAESCPAQGLLASIGQNFNALHNRGKGQQVVAAHMAKNLVSGLDPETLSSQLAEENKTVHPEVLRTVFMQVLRDAETVIEGRPMPPIPWPDPLLSHTFGGLDCGEARGALDIADPKDAQKASEPELPMESGGSPPDDEGEDATEEGDGAPGAGTPTSADEAGGLSQLGLGEKIRSSPSLNLLTKPADMSIWSKIAIVAGFFAVGLRYLYMSSRFYRLGQDRQLPRFPTSIDIGMAYAGRAEMTLRCLDVSQGGIKVALGSIEDGEVPEIGLAVHLTLPFGPLGGNVAWSNAHYAGVLFERSLEEAELKSMIVASPILEEDDESVPLEVSVPPAA